MRAQRSRFPIARFDSLHFRRGTEQTIESGEYRKSHATGAFSPQTKSRRHARCTARVFTQNRTDSSGRQNQRRLQLIHSVPESTRSEKSIAPVSLVRNRIPECKNRPFHKGPPECRAASAARSRLSPSCLIRRDGAAELLKRIWKQRGKPRTRHKRPSFESGATSTSQRRRRCQNWPIKAPQRETDRRKTSFVFFVWILLFFHPFARRYNAWLGLSVALEELKTSEKHLSMRVSKGKKKQNTTEKRSFEFTQNG